MNPEWLEKVNWLDRVNLLRWTMLRDELCWGLLIGTASVFIGVLYLELKYQLWRLRNGREVEGIQEGP